ncbi:MAG: ABC transporter permease [Saprospiraceae bacterium]|nr:ABC transporter permease [Saprospiraceae bacterium]
MNLLQLSWKNLTFKPLSTLLNVVLFALGAGLISLLLLLDRQLEEKFEKNLAGINLVIGAKGSPLQLILSGMYHIDAPTGNLPIEECKAFLRPGHPFIEKAVPLSLGDSYKSYRIVGTDLNFPKLYNASLREGRLWEKTFEVCVGASAAERLGLKLGDAFHSSHGFVQDDNLVHTDADKFRVVGIFNPTGAVIDQLIVTPTQSIWAVHAGHDHSEEEDEAAHEHEGEAVHEHEHAHSEFDLSAPLHEQTDRAITSILLKFKARNVQTLNMQRSINENTNMQAATPAIEITRLRGLMGMGAEALRVLAFVIIGVSGLSIFISLFGSLRERRYELALMRVMGASPFRLMVLILSEGVITALMGYALGMALSHFGMEIMARFMQDEYRYTFSGLTFLQEEAWLLAGALGIGIVAALIPAVQAARTDISTTLAEG